MPLSRIIILSVVFCIWTPVASYACSCLPGVAEVDEAFAEADAVFLGTVIDVQILDPFNFGMDNKHITYEVEMSWKGVTGGTVGIYTGLGISCGYGGSPGKRYLIYAGERSGRLYTHMCGRNTSTGIDDEISAIESLGIQPIEISEGPDPNYPPLQQPQTFCGSGLIPFFFLTVLGLIRMRWRPS